MVSTTAWLSTLYVAAGLERALVYITAYYSMHSSSYEDACMAEEEGEEETTRTMGAMPYQADTCIFHR